MSSDAKAKLSLFNSRLEAAYLFFADPMTMGGDVALRGLILRWQRTDRTSYVAQIICSNTFDSGLQNLTPRKSAM